MPTKSTFRDVCIICGEACTSGIHLKWVEELRYCQRLVVYGDPSVGNRNIPSYLQTQLAGIRYDMERGVPLADIRDAIELLARDCGTEG
jgi:hypothetical protein